MGHTGFYMDGKYDKSWWKGDWNDLFKSFIIIIQLLLNQKGLNL